MYNYIFNGQIHPERVNFWLAAPILVHINEPAFDLIGDLNIRFISSKILASFISDSDYTKNPKCNLNTLKNKVDDAIRAIVDSYCYVRSYTYDVEITSVQCPELDLTRVFDVRGEYSINKTDELAIQEFFSLLSVFSKPNNMFLQDTLADFRRAIKYPKMTASFCYRAIETIRCSYFEDRSVSDEDERRKEGWKKLREACNFEESSFDQILKFAVPNRHGEYPVITGQEREQIMHFTRSIIDKTIQMIK